MTVEPGQNANATAWYCRQADAKRTGHWLDTASGKRLNLSDPEPESIAVEDIAGALSRICRFGGHTCVFYSVAQHSILVSHIVSKLGYPSLALIALHHDSHEAYLGDMPTPLKRCLQAVNQYDGFAHLVRAIDGAIGRALDIPLPASGEAHRILKMADDMAFEIEVAKLFPNAKADMRQEHCASRQIEVDVDLQPMPPPQAADRFLDMHEVLTQTAAVRCNR